MFFFVNAFRGQVHVFVGQVKIVSHFVLQDKSNTKMGLVARTCLRGFANYTGANQPAHPRSLISAFIIHFLESCICKLGTGEISIF